MLMAVLLTLVFSTVWGTWAWQRESSLLQLRIEREGTMLVSSMAIPIINALLYEELGIIEEGGLLDNFISEIMANTQLQPRYAFVTDLNGKILAHNILSEYGQTYREPMMLAVLEAPELLIRPVEFQTEPVLDFGIPLAISGKRWGALRVGVSTRSLQKEMRMLASRIFGFTLVFAAGAMVLFTLIGNRLSRPLIKLASDMEKVPDLTHNYQVEVFRRDEIGQLQQSFARLLDRLDRVEDERNRSLERMLDNERLAMVGKLVSGVAHEVNNPLAGIGAALFNIKKHSAQELHKYVNVVQREVDRIGAIVRQLLDLARAGSLEREQISSGVFFEEIDGFAKMALKPLGVKYQSSNLCKAQTLCLDRDKLYQVVLNLVLNAADATAGEGEAGLIEMQAHDTPDDYCLQIKDNGPGVPPENREGIFELFYTTKAPGAGTGVGLAICRSIVDRHGGSLTLLENEHRGATFLVKIPKTTESCQEAQNDS